MDPLTFVVFLSSFYLIIYFFDKFFKSCMHYPYEIFQRNTGLSVQFMGLRWHTTSLNRTILRWGTNGNCSRPYFTRSFTLGVLLALSLLPIGIILLFITIFASREEQDVTAGVKVVHAVKVELLLPGMNLPIEQIGFYIITMLISTAVHELGHALAAVLEDIPVTGFGFQLYFCLPMAYTEISMEHLSALKWFRKLRILCAGIWHNFLFASLCYLLFGTIDYMVSPLYTLGKNVIVTEVTSDSKLGGGGIGGNGIAVNNVVTHINNCRVYDEDSWFGCLLQALRNRPGYCVSSDFIRLNDESRVGSHHSSDGSTLQCCDAYNIQLCCFEYLDDLSNDDPVEIPQHVCLNIRNTLKDAYDYCVAGSCERGFCLRPLLSNNTTIMSFRRISSTISDITLKHSQLHDVVYMGHPAEVTRTVKISSFVPKQRYISAYWGDAYLLLLKYNVVFGFGLALINAIPCFGLDGHHITNTIINSFLVNRVAERPKRDFISLIVTSIGTLLFACAILKVFLLSTVRLLF